MTIDQQGIIQSAGDSIDSMFDYKPGELVGQNINVLMTSPDRERHGDYVQRYLDTGDPRIIGKGRTVQARRRNGSTFPVHLRIAEVWDGGDPVFVGFIHDLTDEMAVRAREQELRFTMQHMSRAASMGELATGLAHELNQPLTALSQYLRSARHLLEIAPADIVAALELIEKADRQARRTSEIVKSLRRFIGTGQGVREPCDIGEIVRQTVQLSLLDAEREKLNITVDGENGLPPAMADPVQLQQVVHNLLRNAVEAVRPRTDAWIGIRAASDGDNAIRVTVDDNGSGLDPEIRPYLFDRFVSGRPDGLGIGLAICRSIIVAHGGRIFADDRPGGGASIGFTLPVTR